MNNMVFRVGDWGDEGGWRDGKKQLPHAGKWSFLNQNIIHSSKLISPLQPSSDLSSLKPLLLVS